MDNIASSAPTGSNFLSAFAHAWEELIESKGLRETILDAWINDKEWTEFMLGKGIPLINGSGGVQKRTFDKLCVDLQICDHWDYVREFFKVDAMIVSNDTIWGDNTAVHYYPKRLHVLIEHENGSEWDTELWKLIHLRASLKILIGYKEQGFEKWLIGQSEFRDKIGEKISWASSIDHPDNATYLFISGSREHGNPKWTVFDRQCREIRSINVGNR